MKLFLGTFRGRISLSKGFFKRITLLGFVLVLIFTCAPKVEQDAFPMIQQKHPMDCGPVCLQMIATYYNRPMELEKVSAFCQLDSTGTSLLSLSEAAERMGFSALGVQLSFERLTEVPLPVIVHFSGNHFVVVYKATRETIWVADPVSGKECYSRAAFCAKWFRSATEMQGVALLLERGNQ